MQRNVPRELDGHTLAECLEWMAREDGVSPRAARQALAKRDVRLDGERVGDGSLRVCAGQEIRAYWPKSALGAREKAAKRPLDVVYEDEHVLLIVKPQGIPSQEEDDPCAGDTALTRAIAYLDAAGERTDRVRLCHRLDVQTGGLLLIAKDDAAYEAAYRAFAERTVRKFYVCRVKGCPAKPEAVMRAYLRKDAELSRVSVTDHPASGAAEIATAYRVMEGGECARLEIELLTGRTHQIRAHLAHIGHPILGDDKYGDRALNRRLGLRKQQLWAVRMLVQADGALSYLSGRTFECECPF